MWRTAWRSVAGSIPFKGLRGFSTSGYEANMWPSAFQDPVPHIEDIPEAKESGEFDLKAVNPVKAAPAEATCSLFKDRKTEKFFRMVRVVTDREAAEWQLQETFRILKKVQLAKRRKTPPERRHLVVVDPRQLILTALDHAQPLMWLNRVQVGAVHYTVPVPIVRKRAEYEAMRWIINCARDRDKSQSSFHQKLAETILETAAYTGRVIQIKDEHHKTCEINRAYAHYRRTK